METDPQEGHVQLNHSDSLDVRMPVWQFVRLMVKIEQTLEQFSDANLRQVYEIWEDFWVDLDAKLLDAGKRSREEFANLMMDQEVVMHDLSRAQCGLLRREIRALIRQIRQHANLVRNRDDKRNLNFEARELETLERDLNLGT